MSKETHSPENILSTINDKYVISKCQEKNLFHYLHNHTVTTFIVSKTTGIPKKCFCRYKRDLEIKGGLLGVERKLCKLTCFLTWHLTINPDLFTKSNLNYRQGNG